MATDRFHLSPKVEWNWAWLLMWLVTTPTWVWIGFKYPVTQRDREWVAPVAFAVLFLVPELYSVFKKDKRFPPLTHTLRHFISADFAFPLIYFTVGSLGGRWFGFTVARFIGLGVMFAILGWLTIHFTVSYINPDPHPGEPEPGGPEGGFWT